MPYSYAGNPLIGTNVAEFLLDYRFNTPDGLIIGQGGDDFIIADQVDFFLPNSGNGTIITDSPSAWTTSENTSILNSTTIPHTSIFYEATSVGQPTWRVSVAAGAQITLDIDFGDLDAGADTDTVVEILDRNGVTVLVVDDDTPVDVGSLGSHDSFLQYTFVTAGTYTIRVREYDGADDPDADFEVGDNFMLNVSLTGQPVTTDPEDIPVSGNDVIYGGQGNDVMFGNGGDDRFYGGAGADRHYGGTGTDYAIYSEGNFGNLVISLAAPASNTGAALGDTYFSIEGIVGGVGNDTITGDGNANYLGGLQGNDTLTGGLGQDTLDGGLGNDVYVMENGQDTVVDSGGTDTITSTISRSMAVGGLNAVENLVLVNVATALNVSGNSLNNVISGNNFNNTVDGGIGNDTLFGAVGDDTLFGSAGDDTLVGGADRDTMTGGANNDIFRFLVVADSTVANPDIITDFDATGDDRIDVSALFGPALTFRGPAPFNATGQLRINDIAGPDLLVEVNIDANLAADFAIRLTNTVVGSMTFTDFIL